LRYVPLAKSAVALSDVVSAADAAGSYQMINHGKDISAVIKTAQNIKLGADGTVSGAVTGTWVHKGGNNITLSLGTTGTFSGVLSRQFNTNAKAFVVTFTAQSAEGVSLWALRTGG
jgi:arabinan endo-1,5-alpha-L-arabinosidase